jgi:hypothetical protein
VTVGPLKSETKNGKPAESSRFGLDSYYFGPEIIQYYPGDSSGRRRFRNIQYTDNTVERPSHKKLLPLAFNSLPSLRGSRTEISVFGHERTAQCQRQRETFIEPYRQRFTNANKGQV